MLEKGWPVDLLEKRDRPHSRTGSVIRWNEFGELPELARALMKSAPGLAAMKMPYFDFLTHSNLDAEKPSMATLSDLVVGDPHFTSLRRTPLSVVQEKLLQHAREQTAASFHVQCTEVHDIPAEIRSRSYGVAGVVLATGQTAAFHHDDHKYVSCVDNSSPL